MIDLFEDIVARHPDRIALVDHNRSLTYTELARQVNGLRSLFRDVDEHRCVAFELEASERLVTNWLAAFMEDVTPFATIDPDQPAARRARMAELVDAQMIVRRGGTDQRPGAAAVPTGTRYIFFSSGSSGEPKAVFMPASGLRNVVTQQIDAFDLGPGANVFWFLSPGFDASFSDVFTALCSGATLHIDRTSRKSTADMYRVFDARQITHVDLPPALLGHLDPSGAPSLQTVVMGGEVATQDVVDRWGGAVRLVNCYGPTEATICTSMKRLGPGDDPRNIGNPINNVTYRVEDDELWIQSPGIAFGYAGDVLQDRFVTDDEGRWFKTRDIVQARDDSFFFEGRLDRQFKMRGMLVSPEEIEHVVALADGVTESIALQVDGQLMCFFGGKDPQNVRRMCQLHLPSWMIPSRFEFLEEGLPRGTNGKVDLQTLLENLESVPTSPAVAAASPLGEILSEVLRTRLGNDDDFFAFGGDSMMAMEAVAYANALGIPLSTEAISRERTPRKIAKSLTEIASWLVDDIREEAAIAFPRIKHGGDPVPPKNIFLTGATGFLGRHVVRQLVDDGFNVACLVRAKSHKDAVRRMSEFDGEIDVVLGDLSFNRFDMGVDSKTYERLTHDIDTIVHLAAQVNLARSVANRFFDEKRVMNQIHFLQHTRRPKRLVLGSTLAVFAASDQPPRSVRESDFPAGRILGGYACEKLFSEVYVQTHGTLPSSIIRYGLLTGDTVSGTFNEQNVLISFIRAIDRIGCAPRSGEVRFDMTPVDYAAAATTAIIAGVTHARREKRFFHIANPTSVSLSELVDSIERVRGKEVRSCTPTEFRQAIITRAFDPETALGLLAASRLYEDESYKALRTIDLFLATGIELNSPQTDAFLASKGVERTVPNDVLLEKYVRTALGIE